MTRVDKVDLYLDLINWPVYLKRCCGVKYSREASKAAYKIKQQEELIRETWKSKNWAALGVILFDLGLSPNNSLDRLPTEAILERCGVSEDKYLIADMYHPETDKYLGSYLLASLNKQELTTLGDQVGYLNRRHRKIINKRRRELGMGNTKPNSIGSSLDLDFL